MARDPEKQRASWRRYYHESADKEKIRERTRQARKRNQEHVNQIKSVSCPDCGGTYPPYCMDFDHLEDKDKAIAQLVHSAVSIRRLDEEIKKCEVVCSNCHRIRTHARRCTLKTA